MEIYRLNFLSGSAELMSLSHPLNGEGYVFISVGLCVCLTVSNITEKRVNGILWHFQGRWDLVQVTVWNIFGMFSLTHWT